MRAHLNTEKYFEGYNNKDLKVVESLEHEDENPGCKW